MTIYAVAEHHTVHTCPADPEPHSVIVDRQILNLTPGRPCQNPVTIRLGGRAAVVPCGQHEPQDRQCGACRTIVTIVQVTTTDLGAQRATGQQPAPAGRNHPCPICGQPVAAILPRHILCHPTATPRLGRAA
jgi:hypothetical protein